ncbi:MAG: VIT domain-containing protein [Pseudomonadota bacterium]
MNSRPWRWLRRLTHKDWVLLCLALGFGLALSLRAAADPIGDPFGEVSSGSLMLTTGEPGEMVPGPQLSTDVTMEISGMVAEVTVVQRFRNNSGQFAEAVYLFPLPDDAAVNAMQMRIGDRLIVGEIQEKAQAQATYREAVQSGRRASLLDQNRPNLFTSRVANLGPGEEIEVEIAYVQPLEWNAGQFRLRFPMAVTPRFDPRAPGSEVTPVRPEVNPTTLQIHLMPGFELSRLQSLYHDVEIEQRGSSYRLGLSELAVAADRDFELVWEPLLKAGPQTALFSEHHDGEDYALLMIMPPQPEYLHQQPRELIFVLDSSGSMFGDSMAQAKASIEMALGTLTDSDRLNVIDFDSEARQLFPRSVAATTANIGRALAFVDALEADGGTDIGAALHLALENQPDPGVLRQVVFITDGSVANERELFSLIEQKLGDSRLFTVGIGSAPNSYFMRKAAQFGRGSYSFIGSAEQVAENMDRLLSRLEYPALNNLCLDWPGFAETYPTRLPDLYLGEPLMVHVRSEQLKGAAEVCGDTSLASWNAHLDLKKAQPGRGIATLWARSRVAALMDDLALGGDPATIRDAVLKTALSHRLVTRYTSFVAVDKTPVRPAEMPLATSRMAPLPSAALNLTMPAGGTGATGRLVFGLMLLLIGATVVQRLRHDA